MVLEEIIVRWMKILSLVKLKDTGNSQALAKKLGITVNTLYRDIRLINRLIDSNLFEGIEAPIVFDKTKNTFLLLKRRD